jgi:hypothetical protein
LQQRQPELDEVSHPCIYSARAFTRL